MQAGCDRAGYQYSLDGATTTCTIRVADMQATIQGGQISVPYEQIPGMDTAPAVLSSTAPATLQFRMIANLVAARASMVTYDGIAISSSLRGIGRSSIHLRLGGMVAFLREADLDHDLYFPHLPVSSPWHGLDAIKTDNNHRHRLSNKAA